MGFLSALPIIGNLFTTVAKRVAVDKDLKETNVHDEQSSVYSAIAAEFAPRDHRTWWDSFVDGLNRLPRPLLAFMAVGVLVWCPVDPVGFSKAMTAYALVPEWMALVLAQIILLFVGGRMLSNWTGRMNGPSKETVQNVLETMNKLEALRPPKEKSFEEELADTTKPLSNKAIMEWNERRKASSK